MKKHEDQELIAVLGLGRFGHALAETLSENGFQLIIADKDAEKVREYRNLTPYAYVVEHMSKEALDEMGVRNCTVAVVCIGSAMDTSILAVLHLKNLGVPRVIAKATSKDMGQILEKLGAEVVYPEHDMGVRLAKRLMSTSIMDYFPLNGNVEISEMRVPRALVGKTITDANIRARFGLNVIALEIGSTTITNIPPDYKFQKEDRIVLLGRGDRIKSFESTYE